jgi:hypothetical protein
MAYGIVTSPSAPTSGMGANFLAPGGAVAFRVWAPNASAVQLLLWSSDTSAWVPLSLHADDATGNYWSADVSGVSPGAQYRFQMTNDPTKGPNNPGGNFEHVDPRARQVQTADLASPGYVVSPTFTFAGFQWRRSAVCAGCQPRSAGALPIRIRSPFRGVGLDEPRVRADRAVALSRDSFHPCVREKTWTRPVEHHGQIPELTIRSWRSASPGARGCMLARWARGEVTFAKDPPPPSRRPRVERLSQRAVATTDPRRVFTILYAPMPCLLRRSECRRACEARTASSRSRGRVPAAPKTG